jgi:hypothetical protein
MKTLYPQAFLDENTVKRDAIIANVQYLDESLPRTGSNFFIHLTELCPVACTHCMYASTLTRRSARDSFDRGELEAVIGFINQSRSTKLTISGGGEPFLKFASILRLIEGCDVGRIEIVTAGHWARSKERAASVLAALSNAQAANPRLPTIDLRLSIDRFHLEAPRPVTINHYAAVAQAWLDGAYAISLGYRSLLVDRDGADRSLAMELKASLKTINDWNRILVLANGREIPITYNVFRYSGGAAGWDTPQASDQRSVREYFQQFETAPGKLVLATAVNDALHGRYAVEPGVAITLNSDGQYWIFCGTSPDRKQSFVGQSFDDAVSTFYRDPITRLLVSDGIWALLELVAMIDPDTARRAEAKDDITALVDDLLADPAIRLQVTTKIVDRMVADGDAVLLDSPKTTSGRVRIRNAAGFQPEVGL